MTTRTRPWGFWKAVAVTLPCVTMGKLPPDADDNHSNHRGMHDRAKEIGCKLVLRKGKDGQLYGCLVKEPS